MFNIARIFELFLHFRVLDILLMTPTKRIVIYYMYRCVARHHQGDITFFLHKKNFNIVQLLSSYEQWLRHEV